jgi:hypothetical protein
VGLDARVLVVVNDFRDATGLGLNFGTDMAQIFNLIGSSYKLSPAGLTAPIRSASEFVGEGPAGAGPLVPLIGNASSRVGTGRS